MCCCGCCCLLCCCCCCCCCVCCRFSFIFFHFLSCSFIFFHFLSFSSFFHFLSFSFIFIHFHSCSFIFFHVLSCSSFHVLSLSFIFFHFHSLSFSLSLLGAQNLIFLGLNFVTISLDSSDVKNQFWDPSREGTPLGPPFLFFLLFFRFLSLSLPFYFLIFSHF